MQHICFSHKILLFCLVLAAVTSYFSGGGGGGSGGRGGVRLRLKFGQHNLLEKLLLFEGSHIGNFIEYS